VRSPWRRLPWWVGAAAGAGVVVTHWLTYRIVAADHHHRAELLRETGHAHWPIVSTVVLTVFTVVSMRSCVRTWRQRLQPRLVAADICRLVAVQAALWVLVEVGERIAVDRLATLGDHPVLLVGLVVQVVVALLGAMLSWLACRVVVALAARRRRGRSRPASVSAPAGAAPRVRLSLMAGAHGLRGPPRVLLTP